MQIALSNIRAQFAGIRAYEPAWLCLSDRLGPSFDICPCCGCEFGYHDARPEGAEKHRRRSISEGARFFDKEFRPLGWDLREQLRGIGLDLEDYLS